MKINAKPMEFTQVIEFDVKDLIQVYNGRLNACRCGCAGEYYTPDVNEADIDTALSLLKQYSNDGEVKFERFTYKDQDKNELYFEFETHSRYNGSAMENESMGYAFYIKDVPTK